MAQKEDDYVIIDESTVLKVAISDISKRTADDQLIAVDCEGVKLSRDGKLTILLLAVRNKVYIFDVLRLGRAVFDGGLREVLESKSIEKLLFDCRQDADSLWHHFNVKLTGVLDLQLLEVMYRGQSFGQVENIYGYKKCLQVYVRDQELLQHKSKGAQLLERDSAIWERRPLTNDLIKYCCVDVKGLFKLYEILKRDGKRWQDLARLRIASERYVERYRSLDARRHDAFERNAYLPLNIIPAEGQLSFPSETTMCTGCRRLFPADEFSQIPARKREQKCRVCMKVKSRLGGSRRPNFW